MPIIVIIGPSGAGKSSLVDHYLASQPQAILHKTLTTRPIRDSNDSSHKFVAEHEFDRLEKSDGFLYATNVYGYRYGLPPLPDDADDTIFLMLRQQFVKTFQAKYPDARVIQIEAPIKTLIERLSQRGDTARLDEQSLAQEITVGRSISDVIITTDKSFEDSYLEFETACDKAATKSSR